MRAVDVLLGSTLAAMGFGTLVACADDSSAVLALRPEVQAPPTSVIDPTFGTDGFFTWGGTHEQSETGADVVRQADGKLVVVALNASARDYVDVVRLTPAGALDTTFGADGTGHAIIRGVSSTQSVSIAMVPDGHLFVLGIGTVLVGNPDSDGAQVYTEDGALARLDANGIIDETWGGGGIARFSSKGNWWTKSRVIAQPDGKVLVVSHGADQSTVLRFGSNAALDPTFGAGGIAAVPGFSVTYGAMAIDRAGNIVLGGNERSNYEYELSSAAVRRLRANGSVDETFGDGGAVRLATPHDAITSLGFDSAGRVIVGGSGLRRSGFVVRFSPEGTVDPSFAGGASVFTPSAVQHVEADEASRVVAWTRIGTHRFDATGTPDATFQVTGPSNIPLLVESGLIQPDGLVVSLGSAYLPPASPLTVWRRNADGSLDATFGLGGLSTTKYARPTHDSALSLEPSRDGKTLVYAVSESGVTRVLRVTADGKLDTSFGNLGLINVSGLNSSLVDGAGRALEIHPSTRGFVISRRDDKGQIDMTFGTSTAGEAEHWVGADATELRMAVQPDGRIVVAGTRGSELFIVRANEKGAADRTFGNDSAFVVQAGRPDSAIHLGHVAARADGGIVIAAAIDGRLAVVRVGADGSPASHVRPDGTVAVFGNGIAVGDARVKRPLVAFPQPDGGVVVLGGLEDYFDDYVIERFDADGRRDPTFGAHGSIVNVETGPHAGYLDGGGPDLAVDAAGRMYVATIMAPDGEDKMVVLRYTANGAPDETWGAGGRRVITTSPGVSAGRCIRMREDGTLIVGGRMLAKDGSFDVAVAKIVP